ncbi:MAG: class I SAM-dependent methyltransferase [Clostridia bacterium]|nr:class I SAM-dependent methyltransferase [Clostridia bacterium]
MAANSQYKDMAALYELMTDDYDHSKWCDFYMDIASLRRGMNVYEAGCGTGLMTRQLLKRGLKLISSDISDEMLRQAQQKSAMGQRAVFVKCDMREMESPKPVDAVICACDGVNYLTEGAERFFLAAKKALKKGGKLCFDISSEYKLRNMAGQVFFDDRDEYTYMWTNSLDEETSLITMELAFFVPDGEGKYERFDERHVQRIYSVNEINEMLLSCGFENIEVYADQLKEPPKADSLRIHFAAW